MKPLRSRLKRRIFVFFAIVATLPPSAFAYPPAPGAQLYGTARDSFGNEIDANDAIVAFYSEGTIVAQAEIRTGTRVGENYRIMLPLDSGDGELYTRSAILPGVSLTIAAKIAGTTYPAYGIRPKTSTVPEAGKASRLDFTIGEDSDDDGIPDLWEIWQLQRAEIPEDDPRHSLDSIGDGDFDHDGLSDYLEYIAGTFSFLFTETLNIEFKSIDAEGWLQFEFVEAEGYVYELQRSTNLADWEPALVALDGNRANPTPSWTASETQFRLIESQKPAGSAYFYRVHRLQ